MITKYVGYYGGVKDIPEDAVINTYTKDEVFDILEDYEDQIRSECKESALAAVRGNALARLDTRYGASVLKTIDIVWSFLRDNNYEEYYTLDDTEEDSNAVSRASTFCNSLMCKGQIVTLVERLELSITDRAKKVVEKTTEDAYLNVIRTRGNYITQVEPNYEDADYINKHCRIFECKDCHAITYVVRNDDDWKREHGLKPVQRCRDCIERRKAARHDI